MEASLLMQFIITEKQSNQINTLWWNKEKGSWLTAKDKLYVRTIIKSEAWPTVVSGCYQMHYMDQIISLELW